MLPNGAESGKAAVTDLEQAHSLGPRFSMIDLSFKRPPLAMNVHSIMTNGNWVGNTAAPTPKE
jgi:hypothetical protein